MALGLTRPLTEMSTRNISWGVKAASAYGWQPYHLHEPTVLKSGSLNLLEPSGPVQACDEIAVPFNVQDIVPPVRPERKAVAHSGYLTQTVFQPHQKHGISKATC